MTFPDAIKTVYRKYFVFQGRAVRSEFWWYMLFYLVVSIPMAFTTITDSLWSIANTVPVLSVSARRLHDTDRSGWFQLIPLACLPVVMLGAAIDSMAVMAVGGVIGAGLYALLIVWFASQGTSGPNRFGNDPLNPTDAAVFE